MGFMPCLQLLSREMMAPFLCFLFMGIWVHTSRCGRWLRRLRKSYPEDIEKATRYAGSTGMASILMASHLD